MSYWFIKSKLSGFVMEITGDGSSPGSQVLVQTKNEPKQSQHWRFDDATKSIRSRVKDSLALDIRDDKSLIVNTFTAGKKTQRWHQVDGDKLLNADDATACIDIFESDEDEGARVITYHFNGTSNQFWLFEPVPPPPPPRVEFYIMSQMHYKMATAGEGNVCFMQPKKAGHSTDQLFYVDSKGFIRSVANELSFTGAKGQRITLKQPTEAPSDKWRIDGLKLVNGSNDVLDIEGGSTADGAALCAWEYKDQVNQHWTIQNKNESS